MGGFFADVFGAEEETEKDVIQAEQVEAQDAEESKDQRDAEQKHEVTLWHAEGSRSWTRTA